MKLILMAFEFTKGQHYAISSQISIKMDRDCYVNMKTHTISSRDMLTEVNLWGYQEFIKINDM